MKKLILTLRIVSGVLVALVAFVFALFEATLLVTPDFLLYENQLIAFIRLVARLILSVAALCLGITSVAKPRRSFLHEGILLIASVAVTIPFVSNNFGIYFTAVSAFFLISQLLSYKFGTEKS